MRPPILQWKVMLALLAVVIGGASLGSALHSTGAPSIPTPTRGTIIDRNARVGGWTGYVPIRGPASAKQLNQFCERLRVQMRLTPRRFRPDLKKMMRAVPCKHR
jgi:hypothetical protein